MRKRRLARLGLAGLFCALGAAGFAAERDGGADPRAKLARGRHIAEAHCGACHAVGLADASPTRINTPFRELYKRFPIAMLVEAARTGSISGHDEMPGFDFKPADIEALLTYIDSLAPGQPSYAGRPAAP